MPEPMIAPMPSVTRLTAPNDRFSVCSPCSPASSVSIDIGLTRSRFDSKDRLPPRQMDGTRQRGAKQNPPELVTQSYDTEPASRRSSLSASTLEHDASAGIRLQDLWHGRSPPTRPRRWLRRQGFPAPPQASLRPRRRVRHWVP